MPPWFSQIRFALQNETNIYSSRWIQLATTGIDNTPRVRTVVFRGWSDTYEMEIFTDIRSQKCQELNLNNKVEISWLFSKCKYQFRIRGTSKIVVGKENLLYWNKLNDKTKSMWSWPKPGDRYILDRKKDFLNKSMEELSNNFALLKINITRVEQLILKEPIHLRRSWTRKDEWVEERINP